jgi:hypothetical protein
MILCGGDMDREVRRNCAMGKWATVFQCEVGAIYEAADIIMVDVETVDCEVVILSDTQAGLKAVKTQTTNSAQILQWVNALNRVVEGNNKVTLRWIPPGHRINGCIKEHVRRWKGLTTCTQAREGMEGPINTTAAAICKLTRGVIRQITGLLTVHCALNRHNVPVH